MPNKRTDFTSRFELEVKKCLLEKYAKNPKTGPVQINGSKLLYQRGNEYKWVFDCRCQNLSFFMEALATLNGEDFKIEWKYIEAQTDSDRQLLAYQAYLGKELEKRPKCPHCGERGVVDIDAGRRGQFLSKGAFGKVFSGTKECTSCGMTW